MKRLYLCEKPSQGRDIAAQLGISNKSNTHIEVRDGYVSWGFGHLLEQYEPQEYDTKWADRYNWNALPILPEKFEIRPRNEKFRSKSGKVTVKKDQGAKSQLELIGRLMKEVDEIVIATDADREGESIGRSMLRWHNCRKPVKRLWLSALDPASIKKGLNNLKDGSETINLYFASEGRSEADWLIGMNMSRGLSIRNNTGKRQYLSVGRIQTPTLWMVVKRDRDIKNFESRAYYEIIAHVESDGHKLELKYAPKEEKRIYERSEAEDVCNRLNGFTGKLVVSKNAKKQKPPLPFSLAALQKKANGKYGFSADQTLSLAQALYEKYKYTTYPRSDCMHLPEEQVGEMQGILSNLATLEEFSHVTFDEATARKEVYNTKKVTAHHALIPTGIKPDLSSLNDNERKLYLLIAGQFVSSLMPDYEYEQTKIQLPFEKEITLGTTGNVPKVIGWKSVLGKEKEADEGELPPVKDGSDAIVEKASVVDKKTQPPAHYTDATLLEDMEKVGKFLTNPEHKKILKETSGLGTEATRAGILKKLVNDQYIVKQGKKLLAADKGIMLIDTLEQNLPQLVDPGETAVWEQKLEQIASDGRKYKFEFVEAVKGQIVKHLKHLESKFEEGESDAPKYEETDYTSWHKDYEGQAITENEKGWKIPGYGYAAKEIAGFSMTLDLYKQLTAGELVTGKFRGKKGQFEAQLKYKNTKDKGLLKTDFIFPERKEESGDSTGVETADYGVIEDCGEYYKAANLNVRLYKKLSGREMSPEEYKLILDAGDEGIQMTKFISSKTNKIFEAKVRFNSKAKPFPKVEFVFAKKKARKKRS